ncbi:proton ATPase subunit C 1 [Seminavis robusta]|uniref:V-type proton ATPase subunit C n=1 Tax=Seminavis robusta TaxID=568900 RepID=A0A9N8E4Z3_9STRA|nr:proton ATPase subunit C 1 [Seminavis robusta]|eukprot:Sro506_g156360.1 proton ATPase subunit C 1 (422) ;mRNA; f:43822-45645
MATYLIASISNSGGAPEQAYRKLQTAGACPDRPYAELFKLEVPSLTVGTLDTLMTLSDELVRTDAIVEGIVRKIEKTAMELSDRSKADLSVGGVPAPRYIQQFAWDSAKYPNRRPLKDLVSLITSGAVAVEAELKQLTASYGDKQIALQEVQRRKGGNLMSADLNDVLNDDIMSRVDVHDTEYLKTVFVAIAKGAKENFESSIYKIANDLVGYGGPDWSRDPTKLGEPVSFGAKVDRHKVRGSPVVPGSLKQVHADHDSLLYAVTILRSQYEAGYYENGEFQQGTKVDLVEEFTKACRDKRYVVREFTWDPTKASKSENILEQLQVEVDGMKSALMRWCKTHYGDAYVAWMHIKVIRVFVESVLRYGLPVDFTAVLYKVQGNKELELTKALDKQLGNPKEEEDEEMEGDEYHDFVLLKFDA